ncbi:MAG: glutamate-5-semialdehyde dehydrogenase [Rhodospirillaceae bacterium]|nr:glutamate-5-semialdehyde dehydrogenase [Rhodospirillaceae bacterium]MBT5912842.1 glutamate-5-semialdehyde dehydrogenase [Rhodospirillaceae bacterium]MBT6305928.1 glutamate-5-semialdehyde dehydrogenase [Rhodospirillaceae bacterium]MBT7731573.1 glutamate-5-semialdehyde dehydrogenase [Rhodospirillaceae bacterium]
MGELGKNASAAGRAIKYATTKQKNNALLSAAEAIRSSKEKILAANSLDIAYASTKHIKKSLLDRLYLSDETLEGVAKGLETVANLPDPVGQVIKSWEQPNGLKISQVRVPLGVIGIIYESRPNVTADAGSLCLKSGNAVILRGGSESFHTSQAILDCLHHGLKSAELPETCIQLVPTRDREAVGHLLTMADTIDVIVPRGGKSLVERVQKESRIPTIAHLEGLCHVYLDSSANLEMACNIVLNAKMRRPSVCGAAETLLIDRLGVDRLLPRVAKKLIEAGCELRGDVTSQTLVPEINPATEIDWATEYLDSILSIKIVDGINGAIDHINNYGSNHTDSIITENILIADKFLKEVDSAIVLHNASTQYADGGEFGMGAEIGISTGRLHARGPVGAEQLTCFKYVVRGCGQTRP